MISTVAPGRGAPSSLITVPVALPSRMACARTDLTPTPTRRTEKPDRSRWSLFPPAWPSSLLSIHLESVGLIEQAGMQIARESAALGRRPPSGMSLERRLEGCRETAGLRSVRESGAGRTGRNARNCPMAPFGNERVTSNRSLSLLIKFVLCRRRAFCQALFGPWISSAPHCGVDNISRSARSTI